MKQSEVGKAEEVIEKAEEDVSNSSIGFTNQKADELSLLKLDYSGLVFSINILIRLVVISLAFLYLLLVLWIF
jgi:putative membrane protein